MQTNSRCNRIHLTEMKIFLKIFSQQTSTRYRSARTCKKWMEDLAAFKLKSEFGIFPWLKGKVGGNEARGDLHVDGNKDGKGVAEVCLERCYWHLSWSETS